jgi:hypothetical protein
MESAGIFIFIVHTNIPQRVPQNEFGPHLGGEQMEFISVLNIRYKDLQDLYGDELKNRSQEPFGPFSPDE